MNCIDRPVVFDCAEHRLLGILSLPDRPWDTGLLLVVGGPQYRVGSHRQFRHLARQLAGRGVPVLRFDYRGMGDSEGDARSFEAVEADVRAAVKCMRESVPGLRHVVLWGLCDGASASLLSAHVDSSIRGLILLNPWVRTEVSQASTYLRHYYVKRLFSLDFWQRVGRGEFGLGRAAKGLLGNVRSVVACRTATSKRQPGTSVESLPDRMARAWEGFRGPIGVVLSSDDLTAKEFSDLCRNTPRWGRLLQHKGVERHTLAGANHTFSRREWREQVVAWTMDWMERWRGEFS